MVFLACCQRHRNRKEVNIEVGGDRMSKKFGLLILCTLCLASMAMTARANMLTNGNFNTGDLTGWWTWTPNPAQQSVIVEPVGSFDGSPDGVLHNADTTSAGNANMGQGKLAGAIPGATYTGNVMFKETVVTTGGAWAGATFGVEFYDASNNWLSGTYWNFWATNNWTPYSVSAVAPATAASVQLKLDSWVGGVDFDDEGLPIATGDVTLYVDNATLTPEPATMVLLGIGGLVALRRKHA
jgi:hypothetical protein